ncbi:phytanoyl-CoA dioxygenase family protein [bacterium]|jgi:ectoine hydroxylase-related dioxygenase (phytanoyl-CoA dioxygenase family)|nr:phytanoyl-CoA dioxygenase family protein [bacterium]HCK10939.1 phytanoyl-CoA dioxygenase [Candidatus Latescibacterota bacterium]
MSIHISDEQKSLFRDEGYMILESIIPNELLTLLQDECQGQIDRMNRRMDEEGTDVIGINHRHKRYFVSNCFKERPILRDFLFSDVMAEVCKATLGSDAYLFHEQYVVKGRQEGMKFSWHQDSGYVGYPEHKPYLTCWCALDDMSEENGTVRVLPFSRSGIRSWVQHIAEEGSNDKVGYFGDDPGVLAVVPAGSIVAFTSINFHCSGANATDNLRRAYLGQYSSEPITNREGTALWGNAEPFLRDGTKVVGEAAPGPPYRSEIVESD